MSGGIYVHVPFCKARCRYCSFVSCTDLSRQALYVEALLREIEERAGFVADTVYIGGGTPSTLFPGALTRVLEAIRRFDRIANDAEITVEANPDSATQAFFAEIAAAGVNRVSLGLQTTDDRLLAGLGRVHTYAQFEEALCLAQRFGMRTNVDLMLGIPGQTQENAIEDLRRVLALDPGHISLYALTLEQGTALAADGFRPDEDGQAAMYDMCLNTLQATGYRRYEVSNFARKGQESRHNQKYWSMQPYLGLGVAAHSFDGRKRMVNGDNLSSYIIGKGEHTVTVESDDDLREETVMLALRTAEGLDLEGYRLRFGRDLLKEKRETIARLSADGFVKVEDRRLRLTSRAYYVMNTIILDLL